MAQEVSSFQEFLFILEDLKDQRRLFAFILVDERPSSTSIIDYFHENLRWLNSLANASKMFVFLFKKPFNLEEQQIFLEERVKKYPIPENIYQKIQKSLEAKAEKEKSLENPSLKVARIFGITADQLPGIVFFTLPKFQEGNGVFFPLKAEMFNDNSLRAEELLSQIFSIVQKCQQQSRNEETLFQYLSIEIDKLIKREKAKPFKKYLGRNLQAISNIPTSFFETIGNALSDNIFDMIVKGGGN
jgi:hypothetical protein